ncbi:hypothetical protein [Homoserinimonas sp. A520]
MKNTRVSLALAGITVVAGAYAFLAPLFGFGSAAILGIAPTALGLSLAFLFLSARTRLVVIPPFVLGMASATLTLVSWSVGFGEADAGAPRSPLGELFIPAAACAIVLLGASVGVAVASRLRMRPIPRVLMGVAIGLLSVPFVIPLLLSAPAAVVVGVALMLVIGLRGRTPAPATRTRASAGRGVRPLAMVAFAMTVLSLVYGLVAGIMLAGTDAATQAMGIMAAGGNLAAVPLMAALGQKWAPGRAGPKIGLVISGLGVAVTSFAWATGVDLSGGLFLAIPAFVAVWAGTMAGVLLPYRGLALVGISVVVAIGVAVAYFMFAFSTAGAALAVVSGALVFGGWRAPKTKEIGAPLTG